MYLDAGRWPASRFILSFPLNGHIFGDYPAGQGDRYEDRRVMPGAWDSQRVDFEKHPPRLVIDAEAPTPGIRYPLQGRSFLAQLVAMHYHQVAGTPDGRISERSTP